MKTGDRINSKVGFKIDYIRGEIFGITFTNGLQWEIPVYISALGLRPPLLDFCAPGEHNEPGHPDYFKRLYIDPKNRHAVYEYEGKKARLEWGDDEFNSTGKYTIVLLNQSAKITRYAQLRTDTERNELITAYIGSDVAGDFLTGILINIFTRTYISDRFGKRTSLDFYEDISEVDMDQWALTDIRMMVHDEVSCIEYELPALVCGKI